MRVPTGNHATHAPSWRYVIAEVAPGRQSTNRATPIGDARTRPNYEQSLAGLRTTTSDDSVGDGASGRYSSNHCAPMAQALYAACASMGASRLRVRS